MYPLPEMLHARLHVVAQEAAREVASVTVSTPSPPRPEPVLLQPKAGSDVESIIAGISSVSIDSSHVVHVDDDHWRVPRVAQRLMDLDVLECGTFSSTEEYYRKVCTVLSPKALLLEFQLGDASGAGCAGYTFA